MEENEWVRQAQHIFTTSGFIRDHFFKAHAEIAKNDFKNTKYRELTLAQYMAAMAINEHGPLTITQLAAQLCVSSPSASAMVDKLVEKKIITREHSRDDRRKVIVRIHPETGKKIEKIKALTLQSIVELVKKVGPETTRKWCEVLEEIKRIIEK